MSGSGKGNSRQTTANEQDLLRRAAEGDRHAFTALYTANFPRLYRFVYFASRSAAETEEILQDIFLKIWERKETLAGVQSFEDYTFVMARNRLYDLSKKELQRRHVQQNLEATRPAAEDNITDDLIYKEHHEAAVEAITRLPRRRRQIFFMRTQQSMSLNEIAAAFKISRSAVKKHLYASIHFIRQQLHLE